MSDSTFQIGGIASGLDTNALIDAYMATARKPQDEMVQEHRITSYRQELLQTVNAKLLMLQGTASSLANESTFGTYNVYSTLESVATAEAGTGAIEGAYELNVMQLAKASKVRSNFFVKGSDGISSGSGINAGASWGSAGFASAVDPAGAVTITMENGRSANFSLSQAALKSQYLSAGAVSSGGGINTGAAWDAAGFGLAPDNTGSITITTSGGVTRTFDLDTMQRAYGTTSYVSSAPVSTGANLDVSKKWSEAGMAVVPSTDGNITVTMANGDSQTFEITNKETVQEFMERVNDSTTVEVTLSYDYNADTFRINSDTGEKFTISETGTTGFFTAAGIDTAPPVDESGYETVQEFMDTVNADAALNVELSYDDVTDTFTLRSLSGEGLTLSESGTTGFFTAAGIDVNDKYSSSSQTVQAFLDAVNNSSEVDVRIEYDAVNDSFSVYSTDGQMFTMEDTVPDGFLAASGLMASLSSQNAVTTTGSGMLDLTKSFAEAGFDEDPTGLLSINGISFDLQAYASVQDFMDDVNNHSGLDVTISYDEVIDRFSLQSNIVGKSLELEEQEGGFFTQAKISTEDVWHTDPSKYLKDAHFKKEIQDGSEFRINGVSFVVSSGSDTINSVVQEINQSDAGVTAFFDQERNSLVLTADETGNDSISLTEVSGNFLSSVMLKDNGSESVGVVEMGQDARFRLNGAELTTSENTYKYNGLTFNFIGEGTTIINADLNVDVAVDAANNFVNTYNETISYIKEKLTEKTDFGATEEEVEALKKGLLSGNMAVIGIDDTLRNLVGSMVDGLDDSFNDLTDVGISTGKAGSTIEWIVSGKLSFDAEKFREKFEEDPEAVAKLFTKTTNRVEDETPEGVIDGSNVMYQLKNETIAPGSLAQVVVDGQALSRVYGSREPGEGEFRIDIKTGTLMLGKAPADSLTVSYEHGVEYGAEMGLGARFEAALKKATETNSGIIDAEVQSLEDHKTDIAKRVEEMEYQLELYESRLWEKYTMMETALNQMQSDSQYLLAQLNNLSGGSSGG